MKNRGCVSIKKVFCVVFQGAMFLGVGLTALVPLCSSFSSDEDISQRTFEGTLRSAGLSASHLALVEEAFNKRVGTVPGACCLDPLNPEDQKFYAFDIHQDPIQWVHEKQSLQERILFVHQKPWQDIATYQDVEKTLRLQDDLKMTLSKQRREVQAHMQRASVRTQAGTEDYAMNIHILETKKESLMKEIESLKDSHAQAKATKKKLQERVNTFDQEIKTIRSSLRIAEKKGSACVSLTALTRRDEALAAEEERVRGYAYDLAKLLMRFAVLQIWDPQQKVEMFCLKDKVCRHRSLEKGVKCIETGMSRL
ncbi:hypothetical protein EIL50_03050 [bacterium NHP-B]|nr:hypothetical protein EIL50_03050 [bacterium NHP-B]